MDFCAKMPERPRLPHSTESVEREKDMSDFSLSTPSSLNRPTRWGYVVRLKTWGIFFGGHFLGRGCVVLQGETRVVKQGGGRGGEADGGGGREDVSVG